MLRYVLIAAVVSFTPGIVFAQSDEAVNVGFSPRTPQAPLYIAQDLGYFEEEGLKVELEPSNSATTVLMPLLAQGTLDVVFGGPTATLFNVMSQGLEVRIVADGGRVPADFDGYPYSIMVGKELFDSGEFNELSDIAGKVVSFGANGTSLAYMMFKALDKAGINATDVDIRWYRSIADMAVALENGGLDASAMITPFDASLESRDIAVVIADARDVAPDMQAYMLLFSEMFTADEERAQKFLRAYARAIGWYKEQIESEDPSQLVDIINKYTSLPREEILAGPWTYYDPNLELNEVDLKEQYELWVEQGLAQPGLELDRFIVNDLREQALTTN